MVQIYIGLVLTFELSVAVLTGCLFVYWQIAMCNLFQSFEKFVIFIFFLRFGMI